MMNRSLRILVVDDDIDNAQSLGELFEIEGHRPHVVHSGEDAIAAYESHHFDLAFMDVMMPGMNGVESFLEIKRRKANAKVFMMTGYSVEELLRQAISEGALGVLNKPMDSTALLSMVKEVGKDGVVVAPSFGPNYVQNVRRVLSQSGFKCRVLDQPISTPQTSAPDELIILDLKSPLIESVGFYSGLRKASHLPATIILTPEVKTDSEVPEVMRDLSVTGILNKPFDPMQLISRLEALAA
jgi:two-component system, NtrC family, response regulator HydG